MQPRNMSMRGVVDLGAVKAASEAAAQRAAAGPVSGAAASNVIIDVTEATFEAEVMALSEQAPVILDFWSERSEPCKQLAALLEKLAVEYAGQFVLAKVDVDANPRLVQMFGLQSIPTVFAVLAGQPAPLFEGAAAEPELRQTLDQIIQLGKERFGLQGVAVGDAPAGEAVEEEEEPPGDPLLATAEEALAADDLDGAAQAYRNVLAEHPLHVEAKLALAQVELMRRTADVDLNKVRADAAADLKNVDAQTLAADVDLIGGHVEDAFARLVDTVRVTAGDDRTKARLHLIELFEVIGIDDPRVIRARAALTSVLF